MKIYVLDICKHKQYFWTLHNSIFHKFYLDGFRGQTVESVIPFDDKFMTIGGDYVSSWTHLASGPLPGIHRLQLKKYVVST